MKFSKNIKIQMSMLMLGFLMTACSTAVFPEVTEEEEDVAVHNNESTFIGQKSKEIELSMPDEEETLSSDEKNVAYDDEKPDIPFAAKTKPVKKEDIKETKAQAEKDLSENKISVPDKKDIKISFNQEENLSEENTIPSVTYRLDTFYFNNGSSSLDSKYNKQIRNIVKLAKSKKNAIVTVKGYASSRTRNTDPISHKLANFKVSEARAQSVAKALKSYGLSASKIQTEALSDSMPAYQEVMPEGERLNRRAEVYISY